MCVRKSNDPNLVDSRIKNKSVGVYFRQFAKRPFPSAPCAPGGLQEPGRSLTTVYDGGARRTLPWTHVGFSRGGLLMRHVPALPVHVGKTCWK